VLASHEPGDAERLRIGAWVQLKNEASPHAYSATKNQEKKMKATLVDDAGREYDITEHFQVMYDQLVGGMDWGSGFLDAGEALVVMQAGVAAGFEVELYEQGIPKSQFEPEGWHDGYGTESYKRYYATLERNRAQWIKDNLGDPMTWDSIAAYRERLREMEDSDA
jgi:hypothetical protein